MPAVFISIVPLEVLRIFFVIEYATPDLLVDLGVTEHNWLCNGSFGDLIGVILHVGCRIWFDYIYLWENAKPTDYPTSIRTLFYSILSINNILSTWLNMVWFHPNHNSLSLLN